MIVKNFIHHDDWFLIFEKADPDWIGSRRAVHCAENKFDIETAPFLYLFHYIERFDKLYCISKEDTLKYRKQYNNRWHVSESYLEEIPITDAWRQQINEYKAERDHVKI